MWLEVVGWAGSIVLIVSLLQSRPVRLRQLNLVANVVLVFYNSMVRVWPMVGVNAALVVINLWHLLKLSDEEASDDDGAADASPDPRDPETAG